MPPEIKLTVCQDNKLVQTVSKSFEKQHLVKSLEEFQVEANAALTKMIEELGDIAEAGGDVSMDEDDDDEEEEEEDDDKGDSSLSADEDTKGHSKSKKKKHH